MCGPIIGVREFPRDWAARTPDRVMLTAAGSTWSWGEHHQRSNRVAQALMAEGVGPQDRVAFLDKNGPEYFEVAFGAAKVNAVLVAINWRLAPPEMGWIINDSGAKVLFSGHDIDGLPPGVEHVVDLGRVTRS